MLLSQQLYSRPNRLLPGMPLYKEETQDEEKFLVSPVLVELNQAFEDVSSEVIFNCLYTCPTAMPHLQ